MWLKTQKHNITNLYYSFISFSKWPFLSTHSAIIEHTNKVLYMEDDDIAVVTGGKLSIHRMNRQAGEDPVRAIMTLQMELKQIMKGQKLFEITLWLLGS